MAIVGFDFGTTNSLISVVQGDRVISFADDEGLPVPSVACYEGGSVIVGREAKSRLSEAGLGVHGNVIRSPKTLLGQESTFIGGVAKNPVDVVRDVVEFVRTQAIESRTVKGLAVDHAVVTIPVNMEGHRRALLRDAFRMTGISIMQFVHEPLAALYGHFRSSPDLNKTLRTYNKELVLVFDWGGGTLDLTLCRVMDGILVQVGNDGTEDVGGDVFDELLMHEIERRVRLERKLGDEVQVAPGARARLMHQCERAKIDLSSRTRLNIYVSNFFTGLDDPDLDIPLSRDDLEEIVAHLVTRGVSRIEDLLARRGYSPASVALCLATGGMANMPKIKARLHEMFGPQRVHVSERSASLISEGAAWVAHDTARLHLAKNVELKLARNSYLPLLSAGCLMPLEGEIKQEEFSLYCVDPSDGKAKFSLVSPLKPGTAVYQGDERRPLTNFTVKVDNKAAPFRERLQLELRVDENLILAIHGRSLNTRGQASSEVHDLEFALAFPSVTSSWLQETEDSQEASPTDLEAGGVTLRSNLAAHEDLSLVPGEVLYQFKPIYFDTRHDPPKIQVEEKLYYTPCSLCGRASNDPACRCGDTLLLGTTARGWNAEQHRHA